MSDTTGTEQTEKIPDVPQTFLAFRTWRVDPHGKLMSINGPQLTGNAGGQNKPKPSWIHRQMASPVGGWPTGGKMLKAHCGRGGKEDDNPSNPGSHGRIPAESCTCGIYATTSLLVVNKYLGNGTIPGTISTQGQVLGIVELGGRVIPATEGYRASHARIAAILKIDPAYTISHSRLEEIAALYHCPALDPHSIIPEEYRSRLVPEEEDSPMADDIENWLKGITDG